MNDIVATEEKDITTTQNAETQVALKQMNQVTTLVVEQIADDRDKNDELYDFMKDLIDIDGDKNPATREAMSKAMELKMKATDQMLDLLRIKAKLLNPAKAGVSININLGKYDQEKGGNTNSMIDIVEGLDYEVENKSSYEVEETK
jgi:hypothetical protein